MHSLKLNLFAAVAALITIPFAACAIPAQPDPDSLQRFRDAKFGMFIHWGPVALKGTEIGWSRGAQVPTEEYDQLYKDFNPTEFNATEWVSIAKAAGMQYLVITSKHHDGFCLWPSDYTDYDIASTPFGRDVLAELSEQCREQGIQFSVYYSICDWRHPDYPTDSPGGQGTKPAPDMDRYTKYLKAQLEEIITNYGPLGLVWFDGEWEQPWTAERGKDLYQFLQRLQPDILINNRVGKDRHGMAGTTTQAAVNPGDYDTPEQQIGGFNRERPWETCMTICQQWAWKPNDSMKSLEECVRTLLYTVGGDGNLLFNVGPMPDGRIEPRQVERLREMGDWISSRGEAVYETRGGPYMPGKWGASTCKNDRVYLFVMRWPEQGPLRMPALAAEVRQARVLNGSEARITQNGDGLFLDVPPADRDPIATTIELTLDRRAFDLPPQPVPAPPSGSVAFGAESSASNTFKAMAQYAPDMAIDDDPETRWATESGTSEVWLEVDLGEPTSIRRARIDEPAQFARVRSFELQYLEGKRWHTIHTGTTIGPDHTVDFQPVTAQRFRLLILDATEGPTLWEFQLFPSR
jgi:alpha-L-fucosidase